MKHRVLGSLTAAFVMSSFGAPIVGHAQEVDEQNLEHPSEAAESPESLTASNQLEASADQDSAVSSEPTDTTEITRLASRLAQPSDLISIFPHALDSNQAATLYVRSIPVMTFIGGELSSLQPSTAANKETVDPDPVMAQAAAIAARLEQVGSAGEGEPAYEASDITARWDADQEQYIVALAGEELVAIGETTILPDTTQNPAEDALQMANRLRRLLGNAPPLEDVEGRPQPPVQATLVVASTITGTASWYGPGFHGRRSASGEVFNQNALTAAHRTLPFGTQVRVTNLNNGRQVVVRINDRGPFGHGRIIDLSAGAASTIGLTQSGTAQVKLEVLSGR